MATLDELLSDDQPARIDDLLSDETAPPPPTPRAEPARAVPWYLKAAQGLKDPLTGIGQLQQHLIGERAANIARDPRATAPFAAIMPQLAGLQIPLIAASPDPISTPALDKKVASEEKAYQGLREAAGEEGMDWWRVGGTLVNPLSWIGGGSAKTVMEGIRLGAQSGALQALMQPVTTEGNFLWDKGMQTAIGTGVGGTLGGALQMLKPAFTWGANQVRSIMGASDDKAAQTASERITQDTLKAAGADPSKVDPNLYDAIKREVADALRAGVDPDPKIMARHADAAALPVPIRLMRGQAADDPLQFAWEQRVAGQQGVGEPIAELLNAQNKGLIANLNALGAARAVEPFEASQRIISHIEGVDTQLRAGIKQAYDAVKDSAGRPARVDNQAFATLSKDMLTEGRPELASLVNRGDLLPAKIRDVYNDIVTGKLPLTVDTIQFLDRNWGAIQRAAPDDEAMAIGTLRKALNETPIADALGQESMTAYNAAKQLARQRFALIEQNPAYAAIDGGMRKAEPDKFFQDFVANANVNELKNLKQLIGDENVGMLQDTLVSNLKHKAIGGASDEKGIFSQATYNKILHDRTQGPRIRELFSNNRATLDQLYRLGRVSETLIKEPAGSKVGHSNTASQMANIVRDVARSETGQLATSMLPNVLSGLVRTMGDAGRRVEESRAVAEAIRPAVSSAPIPKRLPQSAPVSRLSDLIVRGGAGTVAADKREDEGN